ncbi:hypothetical protein [Enterobacter hormaechei]|uniref:hypothetical protein n=1 Tax=Enterobacter hormaechei TaxID=158836 RepID=UPI0031D637FB
MSTITKGFTKEQLIARINQVTAINKYLISRDPSADGLAMDNELLAIALASLEAEAVAYVMADDLKDSSIISTPAYRDLGEAMERTVGDVVALYTAPPVPVSVPDAMDGQGGVCCEVSYADGWNSCRAAMLHGAGGNSPVIPDGWVMVPVEPTAEMISSGIAAHYERSQIQIHDRPAPGPMECAYVSMLAAAPQLEVK